MVDFIIPLSLNKKIGFNNKSIGADSCKYRSTETEKASWSWKTSVSFLQQSVESQQESASIKNDVDINFPSQ